MRQQVIRADQPHMAAAGLKGDHENFVWCALDAAQCSEVLGANAQQDEQPELVLLTYKVRVAVSIKCGPAESPQLPGKLGCALRWPARVIGLVSHWAEDVWMPCSCHDRGRRQQRLSTAMHPFVTDH